MKTIQQSVGEKKKQTVQNNALDDRTRPDATSLTPPTPDTDICCVVLFIKKNYQIPGISSGYNVCALTKFVTDFTQGQTK
jgi:hypothetical protein